MEAIWCTHHGTRRHAARQIFHESYQEVVGLALPNGLAVDKTSGAAVGKASLSAA